jgi:Membrane domain of glycerophosphoryl diester phosphodiesterase
MRAELRPSSLGEILDRTAQMYRNNFLLYFGIAGVSHAAVLVLKLLADLLIYSRTHTNTVQYNRITLGAEVSTGLFSILPIAIAMAAVMHAVARNYLGDTCTIREAYVSVGRHWYRFILILLAMDTYALLPIFLLAILVGATSALLPAGTARALVIGLAVIMIFAGIIIAVWLLLRWALSIPGAVMEDLTVHRALKRSRVLTKGSIGRIFVMLLLVLAVMMVIQYAIQIPMFVLLWKSRGVPTLTTRIVASFGTFLSGSFVLPIYSIALTLFYYDQRIRKEGYDVEWLIEQAAMSPESHPSGSIASSTAGPGSLTPQTDPPGPTI